MVAGQADGVTRGLHPHHRAQDVRRVGPAVAVVADEDRAPPVRVTVLGVAERGEQRLQLLVAAVDVADDVERALSCSRLAHSGARTISTSSLGLDDVREAEALLLQVAQRAAQVPCLAADDVRAEGAVRTRGVARLAGRLGRVDDDRGREQVVLAGDPHERLAGLLLDVGGVDDRQPAAGEPPGRDLVQHRERVLGRVLVVGVVGHERAAEVGADGLRGQEVTGRERALAGAGGTDQHDEAGVAQLDLHRSNTAICVGGPASGSSGPTGTKRAA